MAGALSHLPAKHLYELAALAEQHEQAGSPWKQLAPEAVDSALQMIQDGQRPALGWWRTHLPKPLGPNPFPPLPENALLANARTRPWEPWELVAAAVDFADEDRLPRDEIWAVLASLAAHHQLDHLALADAYLALEDRP